MTGVMAAVVAVVLACVVVDRLLDEGVDITASDSQADGSREAA